MAFNLDAIEGETLTQRLGNWLRNIGGGSRELASLPADELARLAGDIGIGTDELLQVSREPEGLLPLLRRRLAAHGMTLEEIEQLHPSVARDLEVHCTICDSKGHCLQDFELRPGSQEWKHYCPNADTVAALAAQKAGTKA